ncbi:putative DNA-binding protein [Leucobacter sp. 7(1)]|uniref:PucR family transcriptional regulator n=1 Tax=Leucobacter sp. 7(1) TaxID=1255613 RepID=UPI00097EA43C|nr:helix-turn-helix domain-containing protein [Leucobacter sp. 7(1)]SJN09066.1 putative DNA-binding protein [Leucobacter sp. 7(1)]
MESKNSPISSGLAPVSDAVTLGDVLAAVGHDTVTPLGAFDPAQHISGSEFYDAVDGFPAEPGMMLLAPSAGQLSVAELGELTAAAGYHGASALALKCSDTEVPSLAALAAVSGVPILRVADRVSWRIFDAAVTQAFGGLDQHGGAHRDHRSEPLFALANELAAAFGGSVAIEDLSRRIIAYSAIPGQLIDGLRTQGILTRRVPDSPLNDDQYRTVLRTDGPVVYPQQDDDAPRVAMGITAGTLPLGTIWIITAQPDSTLTPEQDARVRAAATVAAGHMLDDLRTRQGSQLPREERLRTILAGTNVTGSEFAELGLPEDRGATVLAFAVEGDRGPLALAQLRSAVARHLALRHPETVTAIRDRTTYAVLARDERENPSSLIVPLLPLLDRLIGPGTRVAIPGTAHRPGDVAELRQLAERLLATAARAGAELTERIVTLPALRSRLLLERVASVLDDAPELAAPEIPRLCADEPSYAATVLAWCEHSGNVARTARELGVHENTVRHRIRQAEDAFAVPLHSSDDRLTTWLQLRIEFADGVPHHRNATARTALSPEVRHTGDHNA